MEPIRLMSRPMVVMAGWFCLHRLGPGGTTPAAAVPIRYAMPWGDVAMTNPRCAELLSEVRKATAAK